MAGANDFLPAGNGDYNALTTLLADTLPEAVDASRVNPPPAAVQKPDEKSHDRFFIPNPGNFNYITEYDHKTGLVTLYQNVGNIPVRLPYTMTLEEYNKMELRRSMQDYWESKSMAGESAQKSRFPSIKLDNETFKSIFGSNLINIRPQGIAELRLGVTTTKIDNPTLQERMRKSTTFDFDQKIQMNIQGTIGEKLKMGINYNTEATFDFENQINLEYSGKEDEIIKKIEAGNVTLPLPGTLITGSQSLFGIKTEMQFGKLTVTTVLSQQKGQTSVMNIQGGAQEQEFDIAADQYDKNRHFFLSHYFRDKYNQAMASLPVVNSGISINKVEVWITNRASEFQSARNVLAFTDLGEGATKNMANPGLWGGTLQAIPSNNSNELYKEMTSTYLSVRDINQVTSVFQNPALVNAGFTGTRDFEKIENARLMPESEYTLNSKLGYISLNSALNADEILAVAYEYTLNGEVFQVGEFSNSGIEAPNTLFLKLIKGTLLSPNVKTWNLMMKNIYAIGAYQVSPENFRMDVVYMNDSTGGYINYFPEGKKPDAGLNGRLFLSIMELDNLNHQLEPYPDGTFDFVPNLTIYPAQGRIVFPVLEPFGQHLEDQLVNEDQAFKDKYTFKELYEKTLTDASESAEKNKFRLTGSYRSSGGSEISLNAFNIPRGSVVVTAGGLRLTENTDYSVDYTSGKVRILNQGLMESGTPIQVSLENQSLYNVQTKTLIGTHLDYRFNENFNLGGTFMHLRERPLTQKVSYGDEPIANTIWGLNTAWFKESNGLTNLIDKLPLVQTKVPSTISFEAEFAQLLPGHPKVIDKEGSSYIDDFEGTKISMDMKYWTAWSLASIPQGQKRFNESKLINDLRSGVNRSKLAWYVIDPLFLRNSSLTPDHIRNNSELQSNHYVREVYQSEIFPDRDAAYGEPTNIPVLNLAYYPRERGPYNFDTKVNADGSLQNPQHRWGGIMRKIESSDFEANNIQEVEFWLMDPFIYNDGTQKGGDLYINLGNISEDILPDSRKFFEQGMPGPGEPADLDTTAWGLVPRKQSLVNAFSNDEPTRKLQDVGFNGLDSEGEREFYRNPAYPFMNEMEALYTNGVLLKPAYDKILDDPASDDFRYFRGANYDQNETGILDRYKEFNNPEGNSQQSGNTSTSLPDVEDINRDNTLNEVESYLQYKVKLRPNEMEVGQNYITDKVEATVKLKNGKDETINWYKFKIPINTPDSIVGELQDKRSMRFMRMFLHNFEDTVILRFATLDLIRAEWRKYERDLFDIRDTTNVNPNAEFVVSAVNIEENGKRKPVNYILPPGVDRVMDPANPTARELNEQSISMKVIDLGQGDARAVYKSMGMDMRQFKRLKMDVHAEAVEGYPLKDGDMKAFIRIGSDYLNNYYEYEVPLVLTSEGTYVDGGENSKARYLVWPKDNQINIPLELLQQIKLQRNDEQRKAGSTVRLNEVYVDDDPDRPNNRVRIKGNPNLASVKALMIGVRNVSIGDKSVEVWMNELRLSGFDEEGGWAANARMTVKLADLGSVSVAGAMSTMGFGSIDKGVTERSQEDFHQYDLATTLELAKFMGPENRMSVPFYYGVSKEVATPKYYPLDPDIPLDVALKNAKTKGDRDSIKSVSQDVTSRKSINFTNVRLQPKDDEVKFYDVSNLSGTYSYNETKKSNINTEYMTDKNYRGILAYNYLARPKAIEPFKGIKNKNLALIRDFNFFLAPAQVGYRWEVERGYREEQLRNVNNPNFKIPVTVNKDFYWNRYFDLTYNFTKSLKMDFRTATNAIIDEPEGAVNQKRYREEYEIWKDSVIQSILSFGRTTSYQHNINVSYVVPVNKLPYLDWVATNVNYSALYNWDQGPVTKDNFKWGNTIRNSNNIQANTQLNMVTLYNRSKYLKDLNRTTGPQKKKGEAVRYSQNDIKMEKGQPFTITHQLGIPGTQIRVFNESGQPVRGVKKVVDDNTITFEPEVDVTNARVMITGTKEVKEPLGGKIMEYGARLVTSLKNINITFTQNNGTILPGYLPDSKFLGGDWGGSSNAPGLPFMLGWQSRDFAMNAVENNWITSDSTLNTPFLMTRNDDLTIRATIEPLKGLRIELTANHRRSNSMSEYYLFDQDGFRGVFNTMENGSFSMTFNAFATSFKDVARKGAYQSDVFDQFLANRLVIAQRLGDGRIGSDYPTGGDYAGTDYAGLPYNPNGYT
jgi:cell surface protein SprA